MPRLYVRKVPRDHLPFQRPLRVGQAIDIKADPLTLGRDKRSDCWLPEHTVSKQHARITPQNGSFVIEDLESYNHTYVNDSRLSPCAPAPLKHGDEVRVCGYLFTFQEHDSDVRSTVEASIGHGSYPKILEAQPGEKLRVLIELSGSLQTLDRSTLLARVATELFDLFRQADRCFVIEENAEGELSAVVTKTRHSDPAGPFSTTIVWRCLATRESFLSEDVTQEPSLNGNQSVAGSPMRSVMCVPLVAGDRAVGAIQLDSPDRGKKFTTDDLQFLICVAGQAGFALEFIELHQQSLLRQKLEEDVRDAEAVQRGLLPQAHPTVPGYEFFSHYAPARTVGGDYYDFIPLGGGRHAILLGDVSGKGLPAALLMARLSGAAHLCCREGCDLAASVRALNEQLRHANLGEKYITLAAALLDPHRVTVVNAGHPHPYVYRAATRRLERVVPDALRGFPLGVAADPGCDAETVELSPGDSVLLYSDGILDAGQANGQRFGWDMLRTTVESAPAPLTAAEIGERIVQAVEAHAADAEQFDDISLVVFGRV